MRTSLLATVLLAGFFHHASGAWSFQLVENSVTIPFIALDSFGLPRVAYGRPNHGQMFASYDGASWTFETVLQVGYGSCDWPGLVIDAEDKPHMSFSVNGLITYAFREPGSGGWSFQSMPESNGTWNSIALTPQGYPCIAWFSSSYNLNFLYWNGSAWTNEMVDPSQDTGYSNSIQVDASGIAHIAYCSAQPVFAVKYARRVAPGEWERVLVDLSMSYPPLGTSLALSYEGHPRMSYVADGELRYAWWNGSSWNIETVYSTDTGAHTYGTSLALDQYGYPHIAHCDPVTSTLHYSVNQGGGWQTEPVISLGGDNVGDPSLVLDSQVRPHIVFTKDESGWGMYYAFNDEPTGIGSESSPIAEAVFVAGPNPFSNTLSVEFSLPAQAECELRIHDLAGRVVGAVSPGHLDAGVHSIPWTPEPHLPTGQYIVTLETGGFRSAGRVVLLR